MGQFAVTPDDREPVGGGVWGDWPDPSRTRRLSLGTARRRRIAAPCPHGIASEILARPIGPSGSTPRGLDGTSRRRPLPRGRLRPSGAAGRRAGAARAPARAISSLRLIALPPGRVEIGCVTEVHIFGVNLSETRGELALGGERMRETHVPTDSVGWIPHAADFRLRARPPLEAPPGVRARPRARARRRAHGRAGAAGGVRRPPPRPPRRAARPHGDRPSAPGRARPAPPRGARPRRPRHRARDDDGASRPAGAGRAPRRAARARPDRGPPRGRPIDGRSGRGGDEPVVVGRELPRGRGPPGLRPRPREPARARPRAARRPPPEPGLAPAPVDCLVWRGFAV